MREIVVGTLRKYHMLLRGDNVLVALSGGADSLALFLMLFELRDELQLGEICAVHVNHGLRGAESERDEIFVRKFCDDMGVTVRVFHADVKKFAAEHKIGTEEAARELRYGFLEAARKEGIAGQARNDGVRGGEIAAQAYGTGRTKIAVGHNRDDNAETILMNLCRGAGLRGLCGIPPTNGDIIRPLIDVPRLEIEKFLHERKIEFLTDSTNLSSDFTRNRVRNIILPLLESDINSNAKKNLTRTANLLREDEDFLEITAKTSGVLPPNPSKGKREGFPPLAGTALRAADIRRAMLDPINLDAKELRKLHPAIAGRVVRFAVERLCGNLVDITSEHIAVVLDLAGGQTGRKAHLPGIIVVREYDRLVFSTPSASPKGFCYALAINSTTFVPEISRTITLSNGGVKGLAPAGAPDSNPRTFTKTFSCDKIPSVLHLRTRQAGDKISFARADGTIFTKKLQDYFTDEKIPQGQRDAIPLLASGGDILWILDEKNRTNAKFGLAQNGENITVMLSEGEIFA